MKKPELARRLAERSGITKAQAADRLDRAVHDILSRLRRGKPAPLPGLGRLTRDPKLGIRFEREE